MIDSSYTDVRINDRKEYTMDPTYPLVPFASFFTAFLVALALLASGLRRTGNRGVFILSGWIFVMLLVGGVQSMVWADSAADVAPVFCDICTCFFSAGS
jgi:hypothetical protein